MAAAANPAVLPAAPSSSVVTLCFTDVQDSTPLVERFPEQSPGIFATHRELIRAAFARHNGREVSAEGEELFYAFESAADGVHAAMRAQEALEGYAWPTGAEVHVRIGLHTGSPVRTPDGYAGLDVHRAARVSAAGYGGQVLLSGTTREAVGQGGVPNVEFVDLGAHRMKGISRPEHLYQACAPGLPRHFPPPRTLTRTHGNLPLQPTSILGRERELAELAGLLARRDLRLITLTGPGGTGKTRLAIEATAQAALAFAGGVCFVELAPVSHESGFDAALAEALGIEGPSGLRAAVEHLGQDETLLLLDNFEHVLTAAPAVAELLAHCPNVRILVTSREPLDLRSEWVVPVPPLALPSLEARGAEMRASPAVRLFASRAAAVRPGFALTDDNAEAVSSICRLVDGLPLAIELVAARCKLLSPGSLLDRMSAPLDVATSGPRDLPERHKSLRGAIDWSYDLLPDEERTVFRHLAVFSGGFTLEAAEAVVPGPLRADGLLGRMESLVAKNLVRAGELPDGGFRFSFLGTIRAYAADRLTGAGEVPAARDRHLAYYRDLVMTSSFRADQGEHVAAVALEAGNLRDALEWALAASPRAEQGLSLCVGAGMYWWQRAPADGIAWLEKALAAAGSAPPQLRARGLYWLAFLSSGSRPPAEVSRIAEECVLVASTGAGAQPSTTLVMALNILGESLVYSGDLARARAVCEQAVAAARSRSEPRLAGLTLGPLGAAAWARGDAEAARAAWSESCECFREAGDDLLLASPLCWLANLCLCEGDPGEAEALLGQALAALRKTGDIPRMGEVLSLLARSRLASGDIEGGAAFLRESLRGIRASAGGGPGLEVPSSPAIAAAAEFCAQAGEWEPVAALITFALAAARGPEIRATARPEIHALLDTARERLPAAGFRAAATSCASTADAVALALRTLGDE